jgi:hypothetical protein
LNDGLDHRHAVLQCAADLVRGGTLVWLQRPVERRHEANNDEGTKVEREDENRTTHLPYEMLAFSAPVVTEPTEYVPIEQLPVMAAFRQREAARVAAVMASSEDVQMFDGDESPPEVGECVAPAPVRVLAPEEVGIGSEELRPLFDSAVAAFVEWQVEMQTSALPLRVIAEGSERVWLERMTMLEGASELGSRAVFEATMFDGDAREARRTVACLALLAREPVATLRRVEQLVDSADAAGGLAALRFWSSHDADALLIEQAKRIAAESRPFWLERLRERMLSPGDELLDELLGSADVDALRMGLNSICLADEPARYRATIQRHYFAATPEVRVAAVAAGVFLRDRAAWLHCRQMATDVATPRATELVAMLAGPAEQDSLLDWAERAAVKDVQIWAVALTGRRRAGELARRRLTRARDEQRSVDALRHVIGGENDESSASLLARWHEHAATMVAERRYLVGRLHDAAAQRACMERYELPHRSALADELLFRSNGSCRLRSQGLAADLERQLDVLEELDLDVDAGFP